MKRLVKGAGYGNVSFEDVPLPAITARQVLVQTHTSVIARGSEILRRYRQTGPVDPAIMGYALAGTIVDAGPAARAAGCVPGDRAFVAAPHAEYATADVDDGTRFLRVPSHMPWDRIAFLGVSRGPVAWAISSGARPDDTVVVLGQGLVGNLVMQAHRARGVGRVLTVDTLDLRVRLSRELGADVAIDASRVDAVAAVRRLTDGRGTDVVVDCVGGPPGVSSFASALEMVKADGVVHLIGLYHGRPLPLDSGRLQGKCLIGGYRLAEPLGPLRAKTAALIDAGAIRVEPLITHRFPAARAAEAFALLDQHPDRALGVILEWAPAADAG